MTIGVAWVRTTHQGAQELLIVSDSRLNGAGYLDASPKVFTLPRSDAAICFAGDTYFAYPLIAQIAQSINSHFPLRDRAIDYVRFRSHVINLLNAILEHYDTYVKELKNPDTSFLLGGYSWFKKQFCIDQIFYNKGKSHFTYKECKKGIGNFGKVLFVGDWSKEASHRLHTLLKERYGVESLSRAYKVNRAFHYEPFEVVRDLLREAGPHETIGGAPQIVAVSQHMNSRHTAVFWPNRSADRVFLGGRPVFDFENIENWILDPDTFESIHLQFNSVGSTMLNTDAPSVDERKAPWQSQL